MFKGVKIILSYLDNKKLENLIDYYGDFILSPVICDNIEFTYNSKLYDFVYKNNKQLIKKLDCCNCPNITDAGISNLVKLNRLNCPGLSKYY